MNAAGLQARWQALRGRERFAVGLAVSLFALALIYGIGIAPALRTVRDAPTLHASLDAQLETMRAQQLLAAALRSQPPLGTDQAARALEQATRQRFGSAGWVTHAGERSTVRLTGVGGDALAQWLGEVRVNARAIPAEARLARNAAGSWDGTLIMLLPRS